MRKGFDWERKCILKVAYFSQPKTISYQCGIYLLSYRHLFNQLLEYLTATGNQQIDCRKMYRCTTSSALTIDLWDFLFQKIDAKCVK